MHAFFAAPGKSTIEAAVARAEKKTSAEIVVAVRHQADRHLEAEAVGGAILALALLCVFLYWPEPFDYTWFPLEQAFAFALGVVVVRAVPSLKRVLVWPSRRAERALRSAQAAFFELGVSRTKQRNGVLIYVAALERAAVLVPDVGVDPKRLGGAWTDVAQKLDRAVRLDADPERFAAAVVELGEVLAGPFPRAHDDVNELPDAVSAPDEDAADDDAADDDARAADEGRAS